MSVITQAYRTTCIPKADDRFDTFIPSEYIGRKLEVIIIPLVEESEDYNAETLAAMQEAKDIIAGKIKTKQYNTAAEMHADILSEEEDA